MKLNALWTLAIVGSLGACQGSSELTMSSQPNTSPTETSSLSSVSTQILSPNAYKVPYLGFDGTFHLNTDSSRSVKDVRNPRRIDMRKMEQMTFFNDTTGKNPIARDCHYIYLGAMPDAKYYPTYKTAIWDVFELNKEESKDPACSQFTYLTLTTPHDDPNHLHFRYGSDKSSVHTLIGMSKLPDDTAKFNPWWATYCGGGKTNCGKDE